MPWHIEDNHESCSGFAVVKDDDGSVTGCHDSREEAEAQLAALYASENRSVALESEIFTRSDAVLADVNEKLRQIDMIAVPWDQEAEVPWRGEVWAEVFRRGAFDGLENHAGRIQITRDHPPGQPGELVGKLIQAEPRHRDGLFIRGKIGRTIRGDETLALAEDDMLSPSIGFRVNSLDDIRIHRRNRLREVVRAFLDHVSLVGAPAFKGAQVLAVREEQSELMEEGTAPPYTQALDEAYVDPAYLAALDRLNRKHD